LERYLPERGGYFVEAGGYDGFVQSNTYYLERFKNWRGVLIEPIPELFRRCARERRRSAVFNCVLVPSNYPEETATMRYGDLFSLVSGAQGSPEADEIHARTGAQESYTVAIPARTLSSVLDEAAAPEIDLLSLDVEGYEPEVLEGLDLDRHAPRYMLIEMLDPDRTRSRIEELLGPRYEVMEEPSPHDVLYRRRDKSAAEND
jgi:FkbM family methyltransferase